MITDLYLVGANLSVGQVTFKYETALQAREAAVLFLKNSVTLGPIFKDLHDVEYGSLVALHRPFIPPKRPEA